MKEAEAQVTLAEGKSRVGSKDTQRRCSLASGFYDSCIIKNDYSLSTVDLREVFTGYTRPNRRTCFPRDPEDRKVLLPLARFLWPIAAFGVTFISVYKNPAPLGCVASRSSWYHRNRASIQIRRSPGTNKP